MNRVAEREYADDDPPLLVGEIHGLRRWSLRLESGNLRLASPFNDFSWEPGGAPTVAACGAGWLRRLHRSPGHRCGCGLYALHPSPKSASEVFRVEDGHRLPAEIAGLVEAWGRVEVHETGFRAQFARPVALILHRDQEGSDWNELVGRVAHAYRAEVLLVEGPKEVAKHCREHGLGLSRGTVARLVPEEERSPESGSAVNQTPKRSKLGDLLGSAIAVVAGLIGVAFWLAVWGGMGFAILGAILGWSGDDPRSVTTVARGHLSVVDQAVLGAASREPVYVAVVRNDDRRRAGLGVAPGLRTRGGGRVARLARSGGFDQPANVPPGGTGVAVDWLRAVPAGRLAGPRLEVGAFRRAPKFPIERVVPHLDRSTCKLTAEVTASQRLRDLRLIGLARRGGRIVGGGPFRVDSVPRGHSTHELGRPRFGSCGAEPPRWSLYPALVLSTGKWGS